MTIWYGVCVMGPAMLKRNQKNSYFEYHRELKMQKDQFNGLIVKFSFLVYQLWLSYLCECACEFECFVPLFQIQWMEVG